MRLLLGVLLLLTVFAAAAIWQRSWTSAARAQRDEARGPASASDLGPGWSRVIVGRPSGDEPPESSAGGPEGPPRSPRNAAPPGGDPRQGSPPSPQPDADAGVVRHRVQKGESLSAICSARYHSARRELVDAVARFNGLANADDVREGRELLLPPEEKLLERKP